MKKHVNVTPKEYCNRIKSRLDSPFLLGQARFAKNEYLKGTHYKRGRYISLFDAGIQYRS